MKVIVRWYYIKVRIIQTFHVFEYWMRLFATKRTTVISIAAAIAFKLSSLSRRSEWKWRVMPRGRLRNIQFSRERCIAHAGTPDTNCRMACPIRPSGRRRHDSFLVGRPIRISDSIGSRSRSSCLPGTYPRMSKGPPGTGRRYWCFLWRTRNCECDCSSGVSWFLNGKAEIVVSNRSSSCSGFIADNMAVQPDANHFLRWFEFVK